MMTDNVNPLIFMTTSSGNLWFQSSSYVFEDDAQEGLVMEDSSDTLLMEY